MPQSIRGGEGGNVLTKISTHKKIVLPQENLVVLLVALHGFSRVANKGVPEGSRLPEGQPNGVSEVMIP